MIPSLNTLPVLGPEISKASSVSPQLGDMNQKGMGLQFEKMLWSEMLSHAGFEEAMTLNGGGDVSAFARMMVEAIAEDIAEKNPLGLGDSALSNMLQENGVSSDE